MSRPRSAPPVEVSTEPPSELEESFRDDLKNGMDAGRVVCFSMKKILKKLKRLCPLSRLYVVSWETQEKQHHQPVTKARRCPLKMRQETWESSTAPGRTVRRTRRSFGMTKAYLTICPSRRGQERAKEEASQHVHLDQDRPEVPCLRLVRRYLGPRTYGHPDGLRCQVPLSEDVRRFGKHICLHSGCCVVEHACACSYSLVHFGTRREQDTEVMLSVCLQ